MKKIEDYSFTDEDYNQMVKEHHKRVNLIVDDGKHYMTGFSLGSFEEEGNLVDVKVAYPNLASLFLNISDKSFIRCEKIFKTYLEKSLRKNAIGNYFEYPTRDLEYKFFDCIEEMLVSIIFAYTAIEAVCNNLLPNSYKVFYKKKNVVIDKNYIEKNFNVTTKIKEHISKYYKLKIDFKRFPVWQKFLRLEHLRDELIHLKSEKMSIDKFGYLYYKKNSLLIREIFHEVREDKIVQSAKDLIEVLIKETKCYNGMPREFLEENPNYDEFIKHYRSDS